MRTVSGDMAVHARRRPRFFNEQEGHTPTGYIEIRLKKFKYKGQKKVQRKIRAKGIHTAGEERKMVSLGGPLNVLQPRLHCL